MFVFGINANAMAVYGSVHKEKTKTETITPIDCDFVVTAVITNNDISDVGKHISKAKVLQLDVDYLNSCHKTMVNTFTYLKKEKTIRYCSYSIPINKRIQYTFMPHVNSNQTIRNNKAKSYVILYLNKLE
jgi:hypothetical protein